jgi:hypothetical protein
MGRRLIVVLAVTGLLLLLPLWLAWLSMDSRRWQRVERILGREPSGMQPRRWLWWTWIGLSVAYLVTGVLWVASGHDRLLGVVWLLQGTVWGLLAGSYLRWRPERARAGPDPVGADQDEPEGPHPAGRP